MLRLEAAAASDVGRKRKANEDSFCANEPEGLYVVADGLGGHAGGEIASRIAVETIEEFIKLTSTDQDVTWPFGIDENLSHNGNRLKTAIRFANRRVLERIRERAEYEGMATTVAAVLLTDKAAEIAHVGDSRVYLLRNRAIRCLTSDHSWVNEQVLSGLIDTEQARKHPLRNVVTRALGGRDELEIDMQVLELLDGDVLLLCSDGLTSMVGDDEILATVLECENDVNEAARRLVESANGSGGEDNITIVLLAFRRS